LKTSIHQHRLNFTFKAGTSRGTLRHKDSWFVKLFDERYPQHFAIGECSPLHGLSPDAHDGFEDALYKTCSIVTDKLNDGVAIEEIMYFYLPNNFPSIRFGLETALLDWKFQNKRKHFDADFSDWHQGIPINGLIWMGSKKFMLQQIDEKINAGYNCIKIKVGALDFKTELSVLKYIRERYDEADITIRLDANGAFKSDEALEKLSKMAAYGIHSIEQPIAPGQWEKMAELCAKSPVPIALDEELIGIYDPIGAERLLREVMPSYIILKPSLVGGFIAADMWIAAAEKFDAGWWVTSMLESNIGLNAIAQYTSLFNIDKHHGLGTGQLYSNNIPSPLHIINGYLFYNAFEPWDFSLLS